MKAIKYILGIIVLSAIILGACRNDSDTDSVKIEAIKFVENERVLSVGETANVALAVEPDNARNVKKVEYSVSRAGIVTIDPINSSNGGVVFTAEKSGTTVILAKVGKLVDYLNITVNGGEENGAPYISSSASVLELPLGSKRNVIVSLQNGDPSDNSGFVWHNQNPDIVMQETANNVVVLEGIKTGAARIRASHPKAQYSVDILVFVLGIDEVAKYITASENVVSMNVGDSDIAFSVRLVGCDESEINRMVYEVVEGNDVIRINGSGENCYIGALKKGAARVRVSNDAVEYPFEFLVIIGDGSESRYIELDDAFFIMNRDEVRTFNAKLVGVAPQDATGQYSYSLSREGVINVIQIGERFTLTALSTGNVILTIENKYSDFAREILIMVQERDGSASQNVFITTSQNVINLDIGGADGILTMTLVGGVEADRNNFSWVVSDYSIIEASSPHGTVSYARSAVTLNGSTHEAQAIIKPKKVGTATITISNSKAQNDMVVLVKVYPKGTFDGGAVTVGGPGVIRVNEGQDKEVVLSLLGGSNGNVETLYWSIDNEERAEVLGSGLSGIISGKEKGVANLRVWGENLTQDYRAVVAVNREEEEDGLRFIYVNNLHQKMFIGQTVMVAIYYENIAQNEINLNIINTNHDVVYAVTGGNYLVLTALGNGFSEIEINGDNIDNSLTLYVTVEGENINIDQPYTLNGDNFIGVSLEGGTKEYQVSLVGAGASENSKIVWTVDDEDIVNIAQNGNKIQITGKKVGQTNITASHAKSANSKQLVVYVVAAEGDIGGKIVLGLEKTNYVIDEWQSIYVKIITNANDEQKKGIRWSIDNISTVDVKDHYDTAVITGIAEGNVKITVYEVNNNHVMPVTIFITVRGMMSSERTIGLPSSVRLLVGEQKVIKPTLVGLDEWEIRNINWDVENKDVVSIAENRGEILVNGVGRGQTFISASMESIGFFKRILVICAETEDELENTYYFSTDKNFYRIKKGDEIMVNLVFGENGFPEAKKAEIEWYESTYNNVVIVAGGGKSGKIIGKNEGVAVVTVVSDIALKPIEITIEVTDNVLGSKGYHFAYQSIVDIEKPQVIDMPISIYHENDVTLLDSIYNFIEVSVVDHTVVEAVMIGNVLRLQSKAAGKTYVVLSHKLIYDDARILVMVNEAGAVEGELLVNIGKTHYLANVGETFTISVDANTNDEEKLNALSWNNPNSNIVQMDIVDKKNLYITALASGNAVIELSQSGDIIDRIYISVRDGSSFAEYTVATESIIVLKKGEYYETRIAVSGGNDVFTWDADNDGIVLHGNNLSCVIYAKEEGDYTVTVSSYSAKRFILVFVRETAEEVGALSAINLDRRYYKIKKNETIIVNPYYANVKPSFNASFYHFYDNNVVKLKNNGDKCEITGINEGMEVITITNRQCINSITITIEVSEEGEGSVASSKSGVYLSAEETVVVLDPNGGESYANIRVIGEYQGNEADFIWSKNNNNINITAFGLMAVITPVAKSGETVITVRNRYCENDVTITVIIREKLNEGTEADPYIYTEKSVYNIMLDDVGFAVNFEVRNLVNVDYSKVSIQWSGDSVNVAIRDNTLIVNSKAIGNTEITISYPGVYASKKIYIIVNSDNENAAIYLTTASNYIIMGKSTSRIVDAALVNYHEYDNSKIRWTAEDNSIAYVVGSGPAVQVYGVGVGITNIYAEHEKSKNKLKIVVKVLAEGMKEDVCYLTTNDNVIETYISSNNNAIYVSKIGGSNYGSSVTWQTDNPALISVVGSGLSGYFLAKSEGIAKVTVVDSEAGSIEIVVIIRKMREGSKYISTAAPVIQITPGSANNIIDVTLEGGEESDNNAFVWQIYRQEPSSIEVARNGGSVIALFGSGNRANVTGVYAGTARVRVSHPKANDPLYIAVQVTDYFTFEFADNNKDLTIGDTEFCVLKIPNYENMSGRIVFETDNAQVCTAVGTSHVALLTAVGKGSAIIKAKISGTDIEARLMVNVSEADDLDTVSIITSNTVLSFNPRSPAVKLSASIIGDGIIDSDSDNLRWTVNAGEGGDIINLYPSGGIGREVQVIPVNKQYDNVQSATITISHPMTLKTKTIFVQVAELSNAFTLDKYLMNMSTGDMAGLSANIIGGAPNDYNEIKWIVGKDRNDPSKNIVRIMGSGKNVQLYGENDGTVEVTAFYRNLTCSATVTVYSANYFEITVKAMKLYPGQLQADGKPITVEYLVRPNDTFITWLSTDMGSDNPVVRYAVMDSEKKINIDPRREGQATITGLAHGRRQQVNITVAWNFSLRIDPVSFDLVPGGKAVANYYINPPNSSIKLKNQQAAADEGLQVYITPAVQQEGGRGMGAITIYATKETSFSTENPNERKELIFELYHPDGEQKANKEASISIKAAYTADRHQIVPVFERGSGEFSNKQDNTTAVRSYPTLNSSYYDNATGAGKPGKTIKEGEYLTLKKKEIATHNGKNYCKYLEYDLNLGDGEDHYLLFDPYEEGMIISDFNINGLKKGGVNEPQFEKVDGVNGMKAIRINGGMDFIVYEKVGSYYDWEVELNSTLSNTGEGPINKVQIAPVRSYRLGPNAPFVYSDLHWNADDYGNIYGMGAAALIEALSGYYSSSLNVKYLAYDHHYNIFNRNGLFYMAYDEEDFTAWDWSLSSTTTITPDGVRIVNNKFSIYPSKTVYVKCDDYGEFVHPAERYKLKLNDFPIVSGQPLYEYNKGWDDGGVTKTIWRPLEYGRNLSTEYRDGNIRVIKGETIDTETGGNKRKNYVFKPKNNTTGKYFTNWYKFEPNVDHGIFAKFVAFINDDKDTKYNGFYVRNFYTGKQLKWKLSTDIMSKPDKEIDWSSGYIMLMNNEYFDEKYDQINTNLTVKNLGLTLKRDAAYNVYPRSQFYEWPVGINLEIRGEEKKYCMIPFETEIKDGNNVFLPMPSDSTGIVNDSPLTTTINIEYITATGPRQIVINVYYKIRPCHARYVKGGVEPFGRAVDFSDNSVQRITVDKLESFNTGKINSLNGAFDYNGKILVDKDYPVSR